jgi:hypothetical protein
MSTAPSPEAQISQVLLRLQYQELARRGIPVPDLADVEFRSFSQNGEDGVLLYLFSTIGAESRQVVEICAGDGYECNAANLIVHHGWQGLLFDGDADQVARGNAFYAACRNTWLSPPRFLNEWITAGNIDGLVTANGFRGQVDLLSLDVDGNDYWIWKALESIEPLVVVLEFNAALGPERAVTIEYQPDFRLDFSVQPYRCGASLPAFAKLGKSKGYRLIGVESRGINAFFVREGVGETLLPERSVRECFERNARLRTWHPSSLDLMLSGSQAWQDV